jgi:putative transposase
MPGFGAIRSAKRFCQAFDEAKQVLRPRVRMAELGALPKKREHFIEQVNELQKLFQSI